MPEYTYKALDKGGRHQEGSVTAVSEVAAMGSLEDKGLFVTKLDAGNGATPAASGRAKVTFFRRVPTSEFVLVIRRLATLSASGIPLMESLKAISTQTESPVFREILHEVSDDVANGRTFSKALSKHPDVFPELVVSMVQVGETGGMLGSVLEELADFTERDREIRAEVTGAMAYPVLVLLLAIGTMIFLMTSAVPKLAMMFGDMQVTLPLPTVILLNTHEVLKNHGVKILFALLAAAVVGFRFLRTEQGRTLVDQIKPRIPIFGGLIRRSSIARFSRSLGALLKGGVPLLEALDVVKRLMNNRMMTDAVERVRERMRKGGSMASGLKGESLFPEMVRYMISAGEDSGQLDVMLMKIADVYDRETRNAVKVVVGLMGPLMILAVAGMVAFIAMAMLLPIFQMNQIAG